MAGAWLGLCWPIAFQIYFDFSGYSDMAVGLGRMLGFDFLRELQLPLYFPESALEFWRRWHISLTSWFREYLVLSPWEAIAAPRRLQWVFNLFVVWAPHRHLARGQLELPHLGSVLLCHHRV